MLEKLLESLREELGEGYKVDSTKVRKNNGLTLTGVTIRKDGEDIAPTIYVDDMFKRFGSVEEVCEKVLSTYRENADSGVDTKDLFTKERILSNLYYRVIGKKSNEEFLKDKPYKDLLDLVAVYVYRLSMNNGQGSVTVTKPLMESLGITEEELEQAVADRKEEFETVQISDMLKQLASSMPVELPDEDVPMYVISTKDRLFGASVLLSTSVFKELAERLDKNLLIIPSSVHEVIAIPDTGDSISYLTQMVKEVNQTQLAPDEVLSDSVYRYVLSKDRIEVA